MLLRSRIQYFLNCNRDDETRASFPPLPNFFGNPFHRNTVVLILRAMLVLETGYCASFITRVSVFWHVEPHMRPLMKNIWHNSQCKTHRSYSSPDVPLISSVTGCDSGVRVGDSKGNEEKGTQSGGGGKGGRTNERVADYLLGLRQRCLQPAYFLLILILHLVHLLIMGGHFLLQGSFQSCELPLSPPQHLFLLFLG